jgi:hypothetical protein
MVRIAKVGEVAEIIVVVVTARPATFALVLGRGDRLCRS